MKLKLLGTLATAALFSSGLAFAQNSSQPVADAGMETWNSYSAGGVNLAAPEGWHGSDSLVAGYAFLAGAANITLTPVQQIFKTTDSHNGSFAAQIFTRNVGDPGVQPASMTNSPIDINIAAIMGGGSIDPSSFLSNVSFSGGESVSGQVASVSAWLKNGDSANVDSFQVVAMAMQQFTASDGSDSMAVVGRGVLNVAPTLTNYTEVTVNLTYQDPNANPEKLVVVFNSSKPSADSTVTLNEYNSLKVDDVSYTMAGTGITIPLMTSNVMLVYPVPATNKVYFNLKSGFNAGNYSLRITNLEGRVMLQKTLQNQINVQNMSAWARGVYFYQLTDVKTGKQQRGQFVLK